MRMKEVQSLCHKAETLFKSEFPDSSVVIKWDLTWKVRSLLGRCVCKRDHCLIQISLYHVLYSGLNSIWNTLCHELCHAYDSSRSNHGYEWQNIAYHMSKVCNTNITRIGGDEDEAFYNISNGHNPVADLYCSKCDYHYPIYKRTKIYKTEGKDYLCSKCNGELNFTRYR